MDYTVYVFVRDESGEVSYMIPRGCYVLDDARLSRMIDDYGFWEVGAKLGDNKEYTVLKVVPHDVYDLHRAGKHNPRNLPCPTCEGRNLLTARDVSRGYECYECYGRARDKKLDEIIADLGREPA